MNLAHIDKLIESLEKKKSLRPGSPPEVIDGNMGVWRMIRHNRVFIELNNGGKTLGRILIGPPSFVGHKLDEIPSEVWEAMTPRATLKEFRNISVAETGLDTLKTAISQAVGPNDTRREQVKTLSAVEQLVPIARSVGFTDDEIKNSLAGELPNQPLKEISERKVVSITPTRPKGGSSNMPKTGVPDKSTLDANSTQLEGALALSPEALKQFGNDSKEKNLADVLEKVVANKIKNDDVLKQRIKDLADGLRSGKYTVPQVQDEIRSITTNYHNVKTNQLSDKQRQALKDSVQVKDFIDTFEEKLDEKIREGVERVQGQFSTERKPDVSDSRVRELVQEQRRRSEELQRGAKEQREEAARLREAANLQRQRAQEFMSEAQKERLNIEGAVSLLNELAEKVKSPNIKKEIVQIVENTQKSPFNRRSILLRLYQILQILLLLIPGL